MPTFDNNLKSLFIDGKEVIRASLEGKVFYEKKMYELTLTANKPIIMTGETTILTSRLTYNRTPVQGETVIFQSGGAVESTVVDVSGTYDFGNCFVVDLTTIPASTVIDVGEVNRGLNLSLSRPSSTKNVIVFISGQARAFNASRIMIKNGELFLESGNNWERAVSISMIDVTKWDVGDRSSVTVETYFYETGTTDSNGECSVSYVGKGAGQLNIKCDCMNQSKTYGIMDCLMYDTSEYSSTGTGSAKSDTTNEVTWDNLVDWSFTADIKVTGNSCRVDITPPTYERARHLGVGKNTQGRLTTYVGRATSGESSQTSTVAIDNDTYYPIKIEKQGTTIRFYFNDELIRTDTEIASEWIDDFNSERVLLTNWATNTIYIKNMQVTPI